MYLSNLSNYFCSKYLSFAYLSIYLSSSLSRPTYLPTNQLNFLLLICILFVSTYPSIHLSILSLSVYPRFLATVLIIGQLDLASRLGTACVDGESFLYPMISSATQCQPNTRLYKRGARSPEVISSQKRKNSSQSNPAQTLQEAE